MKSLPRRVEVVAVIVGLILLFAACRSSRPKVDVAALPGTPIPNSKTVEFPKLAEFSPGVVQITRLGENSQARFSPDGSRLVYISRLRTAHKQAQVYDTELTSMREQRLTFHDGDDLEPTFGRDGEAFYYTSGTDELKEESVASQKLLRSYYPDSLRGPRGKVTPDNGVGLLTEIYLQSLDGRQIDRLTNESGYDGDVDIEPHTGKRAVFTSTREGTPALYMADSRLHGVHRLSERGVSERGARWSPDGKTLVWTRMFGEGEKTQLMIADGDFKKPRTLFDGGEFAAINPDWSPRGDEIVFSSNRDGINFNLYSIDREGKCPKRLTITATDQIQPSFSPDGRRIVYTGRRGDGSQLFALEYRTTGGACINLSAPTPVPTVVPPPPPGTAR